MQPDTGQKYRGLILDYGGVFTSSQADCFARFCAEEDLDRAEFEAVIRAWLAPAPAAGTGTSTGTSPAHALERGEIPLEQFEVELASRLRRRRDGSRPEAAGLVKRMLAGVQHRSPIAGVVRRLREAGVRTALLSNAWSRDGYDMSGWGELFDAVVVSSEVGMRKPEPRIYRHTAELLRLDAPACVLVDDAEVNVRGAEAVGMHAIHHTSFEATRHRLATLFAVAL